MSSFPLPQPLFASTGFLPFVHRDTLPPRVAVSPKGNVIPSRDPGKSSQKNAIISPLASLSSFLSLSFPHPTLIRSIIKLSQPCPLQVFLNLPPGFRTYIFLLYHHNHLLVPCSLWQSNCLQLQPFNVFPLVQVISLHETLIINASFFFSEGNSC